MRKREGMRASWRERLFAPEVRHRWYLLLWAAFCVMFFVSGHAAADSYHVVYAPLDDQIPFCEYFIIPYVLWYPFWIGIALYTAFCEKETFLRLMRFVTVVYVASTLTYFLWPTGVELRPETFPRENFCTWLVGWIYALDTNTNACPSQHVCIAVAAAVAFGDTKRFGGPGWRAAAWTMAALICLSVMFVKQHSVWDVVLAVPLCAAAYAVSFSSRSRRGEKTNTSDIQEETS